MARFYGIVAYGETVENKNDLSSIYPDVWVEQITTRHYYGDVIRNTSRWQQAGQVNDNLNVNNRISIVADAYAYEHFSNIRYVEWCGQKWKVTEVEVSTPRLLLTIGGVYNGESSESGAEQTSP